MTFKELAARLGGKEVLWQHGAIAGYSLPVLSRSQIEERAGQQPSILPSLGRFMLMELSVDEGIARVIGTIKANNDFEDGGLALVPTWGSRD